MKFDDWKTFNRDGQSREKLKTLGYEIKKAIEEGDNDFNKIYVIPDFDTFERNGQPTQQSILFTDLKMRSFSFNYTLHGTLYSIDFWKPRSKNPSISMILHKITSEDLYLIIPEIAKNPNKNVNVKQILNAKKESVTEGEFSIDVKIEDAKQKTDRDPLVKKAEQKAEDYEWSDPETIFEDLNTYIDMVIEGKQPSLILTGTSGVGKTYLVLKRLRDKGLKNREDFIHVKGRSTAAGMYITLYENCDKIVVLDDCDSIFSSMDAVNILKGALDSYDEREISWLVGRPLKTSTGETVPKNFIFTGKVIFISNLPQRKIDTSIKTRSFILEVALAPSDMIKKMKKDLPNVLPEIPRYLRDTAMDFIEEIAAKNDDLELNMRTLIKAIKIVEDVDNLNIVERLIIQQCSYR